MEARKERLARDSVRDATSQEIHALKRENGELKQLVAELSLEAYRLKEVKPVGPDVMAVFHSRIENTTASLRGDAG
jgi:hypothetical protein